jgi:hypothetical protein
MIGFVNWEGDRTLGMRRLILIVLVALAVAPGIDSQVQPKTAHDYYKQLYTAGGLQKYSQYACFFEDDTAPFRDYFFTVVFSEELLDSMKGNPSGADLVKALPKQEQVFFLKKSAGIYRYNRGVYMNGVVVDKEAPSSWVRMSDDGKQKERFKFQRQTLRFAWMYEALKPEKDSSSSPIFGQCEKVPSDIPQVGEN